MRYDDEKFIKISGKSLRKKKIGDINLIII